MLAAIIASIGTGVFLCSIWFFVGALENDNRVAVAIMYSVAVVLFLVLLAMVWWAMYLGVSWFIN